MSSSSGRPRSLVTMRAAPSSTFARGASPSWRPTSARYSGRRRSTLAIAISLVCARWSTTSATVQPSHRDGRCQSASSRPSRMLVSSACWPASASTTGSVNGVQLVDQHPQSPVVVLVELELDALEVEPVVAGHLGRKRLRHFDGAVGADVGELGVEALELFFCRGFAQADDERAADVSHRVIVAVE